MSPKFGRLLPLIKNVPHFSGIRIHRGNIPKHSYGCILVGENKIKGKVINSTGYETMLVGMMQVAIARDEEIKIEIATDEDLFNYRKFIVNQLKDNELRYDQRFRNDTSDYGASINDEYNGDGNDHSDLHQILLKIDEEIEKRDLS